MSKKRNIAGVTVFVSNETYNEYKGTLQEQIEQLQQENKQLKSILTELEEYMKENEGMYILYAINRLQELKEKYK